MWYAIVIVGTIITLVFYRIFSTFWRGKKFTDTIWQNKPGAPKSVETYIYNWINESPNRIKQRDIFVQFQVSGGVGQSIIVDRLVGCIMASWGENPLPFGKVLFQKINENFFWTDPQAQEYGKLMMEALKAELISLDTE